MLALAEVEVAWLTLPLVDWLVLVLSLAIWLSNNEKLVELLVLNSALAD